MSEKSIYQSLMNIQQKIPMLRKNATGYGYKYTTLEEILNEVMPLCEEEGLFLTCESNETTNVENGQSVVSVKTVFFNAKGERFDGYKCEFNLPIQGIKKYGQDVGSLITYGRRYSLCATLSIAVTDDDAIFADSNLSTISEEQYEDILATLTTYANSKGKDVKELISWVSRNTNKPNLKRLTQSEYFRLKEKFSVRKDVVDE